MDQNSTTAKKKASLGSKAVDNFRVVVRVRPLLQKLPACVVADEEKKSVTITKPEKKKQIDIEDFREIVGVDANQTHVFTFDEVFEPSAAQVSIFVECVQPIVDSVLEGYNGSVIASGQTGSGKTYTIEGGGQEESKGIIPRVTEQIFGYIQNIASETDRFLVRVSFLQIYNEKLSDLLDQKHDNLKLREDGLGGVYIESLSEHVVRNTDEILHLVKLGSHQRATAATKSNKESSRSHAVFTIIVEHAQYDSSGGSVITIGKMRMVDLAGSERLDTDAESKQQEETKNINVSLHTFGKVVTALTTPGARHIPYRESKLTRILQDSLGGNCKTTLIATINPLASCFTETFNTLSFAKRAKNIKNTATVNKDISHKALLSAYEHEIQKLREELQQRDTGVDKEQIERLAQECQEAQREKDEVLEKLEAQQKKTVEVELEKSAMMKKIADLENAVLHRSSVSVTESEEFRQAVKKEQERIRKETESRLENKLAELDKEKKRLQEERAEIQKEKERYAKIRAEFQPDGRKEDESTTEILDLLKRNRQTTTPPSSASIRKPNSANASTWAQRCPLPGEFSSNHYQPTGRRISSAESLSSIRKESSASIYPRINLVSASFEKEQHTISQETISSHQNSMDDTYKMYLQALTDPRTGIPCQELQSGLQIFNGSDAAQWFKTHVHGVSTTEAAQAIGQTLMDLNMLVEIQGGNIFTPSDSVYYQLSEPSLTPTPKVTTPRHKGSQPSLLSGSQRSVSALRASDPIATSMTSIQTETGPPLGGDPMVTYELSQYAPTPLHTAALYGDKNSLKMLATEYSVDIPDKIKQTPLIYAVLGRQAKCCSQLIHLGADVNAVSFLGQTALLLAISCQYHSIVKLLLKNGAQTQFQNETAFHAAARLPNPKCLQYLCKYVVTDDLQSINKRDYQYHTSLHVSVLHNFPEHTKMLLEAKADISVSDQDGRTALHYAVSQNYLTCVQIIIETDPNDINLVDTVGWSALHLACQAGFFECVKCLVSCPNCDYNLKDQNGCTPLHIAVKYNKEEVVRVLVNKGASIALKDNKEKTPLHYCMELGHTGCGRAIQILSSR